MDFRDLYEIALRQRTNHSFVNIRDTDADGEADWSSGVLEFDDVTHFVPVFSDGVFHGKTSLLIHAPKSHTIEVYAWEDQTNDFTEFLGTIVADGNNRVTVPLSRAIHHHDNLRPYDSTEDAWGPAVEASHAFPRIDRVEPREGTELGGTTVTIYGESFPVAASAKVFFGDVEATVVARSTTEYVVTTGASPQLPRAFDVVPVTIDCPGNEVADGAEFHYLDVEILESH